jgi:hypothetical protein
MFFTRKSFTNGIGRSQGRVQQVRQGCLCINRCGTPVPSSPLTMMTLENTEEDPHDPEPAYGNILIDTHLISCADQM